ncbi:hypothetical protein [Sphingobacterium sp. DR205]|nr:hypothetical protein [Sphingobacterium sp. DR205]QIH36720.1 hypothetical protein G6053_29420 [Sphingobacterium sp. DR205]HAF34728.1 hypothetical protein [Sphingobacterium sp.]
MIVSLQKLTILIEAIVHLKNTDIPKHFCEITEACNNNFALALEAHREIIKVDSARQAIQLYHTQLLHLYHLLSSFCKKGKIENPTALFALEELLERIEHLFKKDIDPCTPLPEHYYLRMHEYVYANMPGILDKLTQKNIPKAYLTEILSAMDSLFENGKIPYIQFRHQDYLPKVIESLRQLADDRRQSKNWHYRFLVLMVKLNFNHMGFFNRWKELHTSNTTFMDLLIRFPKHFSCIPGFAYDSNSRSLLKLMREYMEDENISQSAAMRDDPQQFIQSNFNGKELKLWMHISVKANIMWSSEKKEVAEVFSRLVKTREGTLLSAHSLTRMDKSAEFHAAIRIRKVLNTMLAELNEQFPELKQ